jgi:hypothetical protein
MDSGDPFLVKGGENGQVPRKHFLFYPFLSICCKQNDQATDLLSGT